jgi:hypothetical protein
MTVFGPYRQVKTENEEKRNIILHVFYTVHEYSCKGKTEGYRMHGRCAKCTTGFSKNLKLRTSFECLSVDWLTVLQVTLNKQTVRVFFFNYL